MRIRKRQVPLPLSSLSPVPLSDLRLDPPVQLLHSLPLPPLPNQQLNLEKEEEDEKKRIDSSDPSIFFVAPTNPTTTTQSISSSNQVERWCDGDKAFPLKKRRGSFERKGMSSEAAKMKTKMNNKCDLDHHHLLHDDDDVQKREREVGIVDGSVGSNNINNNGRKKKRGGRGGGAVLMEGSRCSRVNGRGWRCCQQTLVGYSLCEHHLGKGRLRSMASVRSRSLAAPKKKKSVDQAVVHGDIKISNNDKVMLVENQSKPVSCFLLSDQEEDEEDEKKAPLMLTNKKRMRLGMVKARSMSSLLGQPQPINNNSITYAVPADHDHHDHNHMKI